MSTTVNWAKLVEKNRAKAHGIPWSDEENEAIQSGINPDDVRAGLLTKEDVKKAEKGSMERMSMEDLVKMAKELKIEFDAKAVNKNDLIVEIKKAQKKKNDEKKKALKKANKNKKKAGK
ncbi:Rho termination factor N-terminal domain-containing protein [bacterium]|nr:Rho termination factor N-terminal domain-containing protein [bacterium]